MGILNNLYKKLSERIIRQAPDARIQIEAAIRKGFEPASRQLRYDSIFRKAQQLKDWKNAVSAATDPEYPAKTALWQFYDNLLLDNHLRSCIDTRIAYVKKKPFKLIDDQGVEHPEETWLLERPWMEQLIQLAIMSKFVGTTLIELYDINKQGELSGITEIPSPYFNAVKGIITKEKDESSGWLYKEAPYQNYYVQIGQDKDLGELERLGPTVLAKKLALGAYQDYIEKYGVPPLFITTDREDDTRLDELEEAAENFRHSSYMVGKGNEKFEVGNVSGEGTGPFLDLVEFVNDEVSKAILGGTGLNSEKSFVGSASIQMDLLENRLKSDALFFKYLFNEEIKPRLVNLSSVYQPLENLYFEYDETESLNLKEYIDAISRLGSQYEIEATQIEERTGIKIMGIKEKRFPEFPHEPQGGEDKGK